jgi:hypothetical protein
MLHQSLCSLLVHASLHTSPTAQVASLSLLYLATMPTGINYIDTTSNSSLLFTDNPPPYSARRLSRSRRSARTRRSASHDSLPISPSLRTPPLSTSQNAGPSSPLPSYTANGGPPPYFPRTPLERWTALLRRPRWEVGDLSAFEPSGRDTWEHEYAALTAEMREWELPVDPNANIRRQMQDPAGWLAVTEVDVQFVDASFPPELCSKVLLLPSPSKQLIYLVIDTALTLRPAVEADFMYDHLGFNPDLEGMWHAHTFPSIYFNQVFQMLSTQLLPWAHIARSPPIATCDTLFPQLIDLGSILLTTQAGCWLHLDLT